ncbi:MAG: DUF3298 domain-containing protein [Opitutales bacterium]|nr:DUF3298 domain-containing protein [Opitutales bacterium]
MLTNYSQIKIRRRIRTFPPIKISEKNILAIEINYGNDKLPMKNTVFALFFSVALLLATPAIFAQNTTLSTGQKPQQSILRTHYNTTQRLVSGLSLNFDFDIDTLQNEPEFNQLLLNTALRFNAGTHVPDNAIRKFVETTRQKHPSPNGIINEFFFRVSAKIESPARPNIASALGSRYEYTAGAHGENTFSCINFDLSEKINEFFFRASAKIKSTTRPNIASALVSRYEYTAGAHGENTFSCINFDLSEKKQLFFKDIFKENCEKKLTELLKKHDPRRKTNTFEYAKEENEIPAQPHPTENFLLRADGVLFVYGPYEIDCHAAGPIFIRVPADEIAPLLK